MQPYLFPYFGYFQLINTVDKYVVLDDVQFIKGGWINRNKILFNNTSKLFTFSVRHAPYNLNICERYFTDSFEKEKIKLLMLLQQSYKKAPYFRDVFALVERILNYKDKNIAALVTNSLVNLCDYMGIETQFIVSSRIERDRTKKKEEMVIDIVKQLGGFDYVNAVGGQTIYTKNYFKRNGINIKFLQMGEIEYKQFDNPFVPNLSIIDVLMFNNNKKITSLLKEYSLI